jgi:hypothetical protein
MEQHTRYVMLAKIKNKDTESVVSALIKQSKKLHVLHRPIETAAVCGLY